MDVVERWKPIVGFEGKYEVSDLGNVRSLDRVVLTRVTPFLKKGRPMKQHTNSDGYKSIGIGAKNLRTVHSLVLEAFVGPRPNGFDSCHLNGKRDDNRLCNLKWGSKSENQQHKRLHGTDARGERSVRAKLTYGDVERIRDMKACGCSNLAIARWFNISTHPIFLMLRDRRWGEMTW